jgi:hypothetical protein
MASPCLSSPLLASHHFSLLLLASPGFPKAQQFHGSPGAKPTLTASCPMAAEGEAGKEGSKHFVPHDSFH